MTDAELITRIVSGEERLFADLVKRYMGCVWAVCSSYVGNPSDREEVSQEVFVNAYLRLNTLRDPQAFGRWLTQLARRRCLDWLRSAARRKNAMDEYEELAQGAPDQVDAQAQLSRKEIQDAIFNVVQTLPPQTREAVLLCFSEGYSTAEAAEMLGLSCNALKRRLQYGKKLLHERINAEFEPALASRKHSQSVTGAALAAIPFGKAPWISGATAAGGSAASLAISGGAIIMGKKVLFAAIVLIVVAGALWLMARATGGGSGAESGRTEVLAETARGKTGSTTSKPPSEDIAATDSGAPEQPASEPVDAAEADSATGDPAAADGGTDEAEPEETGRLAGVVYNDDAYPLPDAEVLVDTMSDPLDPYIGADRKARTASDGAFELQGLPVNTPFDVYATAQGYVTAKRRDVKIESDATALIDFALAPARFFVAGHVLTEADEPIPGASVELRCYGSTGQGEIGAINGYRNFSFVLSDAEGAFTISVPNEGLCDFTVLKEGYGTGFFSMIATGTEDARFVLREPGSIAGRVTDAGGNPAAGLTVMAKGTICATGLDPRENAVQEHGIVPVTSDTQSDGTYVVAGLSGDYLYDVWVNKGETEQDSSNRLGYRRCIEVEAGKTTSGIDFVLQSHARIYGTVTDPNTGKAVYPARVFGNTANENGRPVMTATALTDAQGAYEMDVAIEKALEMVLAVAYCHPNGTMDATGLEEEPRIKISPGEEKELNIHCDAPMTIPIRCADPEGRPMPGLSLCVGVVYGHDSWAAQWPDQGPTDAEGRYVCSGLAADRTYWVFATLQDKPIGAGGQVPMLAKSGEINGAPGETVSEVVLVVASKGGVQGIVLDQAGAPLADSSIALMAILPDGTRSELQHTVTDGYGRFTLVYAFAAGKYSTICVGRLVENRSVEAACVDNWVIQAETVSDMGELRLTQLSPEESAAILADIQ